MCLVHLLRDLEYVETYKRVDKHWSAFAKKLRRLLGDAIRLWRRDQIGPSEFASRPAGCAFGQTDRYCLRVTRRPTVW